MYFEIVFPCHLLSFNRLHCRISWKSH